MPDSNNLPVVAEAQITELRDLISKTEALDAMLASDGNILNLTLNGGFKYEINVDTGFIKEALLLMKGLTATRLGVLLANLNNEFNPAVPVPAAVPVAPTPEGENPPSADTSTHVESIPADNGAGVDLAVANENPDAYPGANA